MTDRPTDLVLRIAEEMCPLIPQPGLRAPEIPHTLAWDAGPGDRPEDCIGAEGRKICIDVVEAVLRRLMRPDAGMVAALRAPPVDGDAVAAYMAALGVALGLGRGEVAAAAAAVAAHPMDGAAAALAERLLPDAGTRVDAPGP